MYKKAFSAFVTSVNQWGGEEALALVISIGYVSSLCE